MSDIEPTEQLTAWQIVEQAWRDWFPHSPPIDFVIEESVPNSLVYEPDLKLTQAQALAALEYWRFDTIKAVENVAARYRSEISSRLSEPTEMGSIAF